MHQPGMGGRQPARGLGAPGWRASAGRGQAVASAVTSVGAPSCLLPPRARGSSARREEESISRKLPVQETSQPTNVVTARLRGQGQGQGRGCRRRLRPPAAQVTAGLPAPDSVPGRLPTHLKALPLRSSVALRHSLQKIMASTVAHAPIVITPECLNLAAQYAATRATNVVCRAQPLQGQGGSMGQAVGGKGCGGAWAARGRKAAGSGRCSQPQQGSYHHWNR